MANCLVLIYEECPKSNFHNFFVIFLCYVETSGVKVFDTVSNSIDTLRYC